MPEEFRSLLAKEFAPYATLSSTQLDLLEQYYALLRRWNARMNLTRIQRLEDVVRLHYCESLFLGTLLPPGELIVADIGSGPGFPGIPVAVLRPECSVALIESHKRKAVFLREASSGLPNVRVLASRAEDVQEKFDWSVSRAVAPADVLALNLARNTALLIGEEDAKSMKGWDLIPIPWGRGRFAVVPRETQT